MYDRAALLWFVAALGCSTAVAAGQTVASPDGKVAVTFALRGDGTPTYAVTYDGRPLVLSSRLGFDPDLRRHFEVTGSSTSAHRDQWRQTLGERAVVPDRCDELDVDLRHRSGRLMRLTFRAYDEGAALRYTFPPQSTPAFRFTAEQTEFRLPPGTSAYEEHGTEGEYTLSKIEDVHPECERPLTLAYADGRFACLAEADNERYPRMLLSPVAGGLVTAVGGSSSNLAGPRFAQRPDPTATVPAGGSTPWRMLVVGQRPGDLLERNYLMLNLCPPLALADTAWIRPGMAMRDTTLSTVNSKAIIDFAATGGLRYVLLDDGWYGHEDPATGDATTVRRPDLDVQEVIRYGRTKGVGLILYVDRRQAMKQRDVLFPLYEKWGVAGVKLGFVNVGPQAETAWITDTIHAAAAHHLVLDVHDGYRPTGYTRTYPNLMTVEGVRGNEHHPTAAHNCTLPFTRDVAGAADYTICYMDRRDRTTHAHQMALAVVYFSPLTSLYWYDRPDQFHAEPELEFFRHVPTVWDETRVLDGEIGRHAVVARRSGDDWYVGAITGEQAWTAAVPLSFLTPGRAYAAQVYGDDDAVPTTTHIGISTRAVRSDGTLMLPLRAAGGAAVRITPAP